MVGWVLFRAETFPQALGYLAAMARLGDLAAPPIDLLVLLNNERLAAIAAGLVFAVPTLPWLLERLRAPRLPAAQSLEASTMGEPIYARMGYEELYRYTSWFRSGER